MAYSGTCLVNLQHPEDKSTNLAPGDPIKVADRTQFEWLITIGSIEAVAVDPKLEPEIALRSSSKKGATKT